MAGLLFLLGVLLLSKGTTIVTQAFGPGLSRGSSLHQGLGLTGVALAQLTSYDNPFGDFNNSGKKRRGEEEKKRGNFR